MRRVAGNGYISPSGDGGPATAAAVFSVGGIAFDRAGNLFLTETMRNCIRRVAVDGTITTYAGVRDWYGGYRGDNGLAAGALFDTPRGLAMDRADNLYVADDYNDRVRRITSGGIVTTVAGSGVSGYNGDGMAARTSLLLGPTSLVVDDKDNLLIVDRWNRRLRQVTPAGVISTLAVSGLIEPVLGSDLVIDPSAVGFSPRGILLGDSGSMRVLQLTPRQVTVCTYALEPQALPNVPAAGASGSISVVTQAGCAWRASSNRDWLMLGNLSSGTGAGTLPYSIAPNSASSNRTGEITLGSVSMTVTQLGLPVPVVNVPVISNAGVVNTASYESVIVPDSYVTIYGRNLAPPATVVDWNSVIPNGSTLLPTLLAGTRVRIFGKDAYIYYVNGDLGMVTVLAPSGIPAGTVTVEVTTANGTGSAIVQVAERSPAFFTFQADGQLYASALFANERTYVAAVGALPGVASRPAKAGDRLVLFVNALGPTGSPIPAGQAFAPGTYFPAPDLSALRLTMGGRVAAVEFAGMTIAGVWQLNVLVPEGVPGGDQPIILQSGSAVSQAAVRLRFAFTEQ